MATISLGSIWGDSADFDILLVEIVDVFVLIEIDGNVVFAVFDRKEDTFGHVGREWDIGWSWAIALVAIIIANHRATELTRCANSEHGLVGVTASDAV